MCIKNAIPRKFEEMKCLVNDEFSVIFFNKLHFKIFLRRILVKGLGTWNSRLVFKLFNFTRSFRRFLDVKFRSKFMYALFPVLFVVNIHKKFGIHSYSPSPPQMCFKISLTMSGKDKVKLRPWRKHILAKLLCKNCFSPPPRVVWRVSIKPLHIWRFERR